MAFEASYGNGFLDRLEHRQQYKFNGERVFNFGQHRLTLFGIAYYGFSYIPGLVPIFPPNSADANFPNYGDTIDPRQKDQTHTALVAVNDVWQFGRKPATATLRLFSHLQSVFVFRFRTGPDPPKRVPHSRWRERELPKQDCRVSFFAWQASTTIAKPRGATISTITDSLTPPMPSYYGPFTPIDANNITIRIDYTLYCRRRRAHSLFPLLPRLASRSD